MLVIKKIVKRCRFRTAFSNSVLGGWNGGGGCVFRTPISNPPAQNADSGGFLLAMILRLRCSMALWIGLLPDSFGGACVLPLQVPPALARDEMRWEESLVGRLVPL